LIDDTQKLKEPRKAVISCGAVLYETKATRPTQTLGGRCSNFGTSRRAAPSRLSFSLPIFHDSMQQTLARSEDEQRKCAATLFNGAREQFQSFKTSPPLQESLLSLQVCAFQSFLVRLVLLTTSKNPFNFQPLFH
jgi:hypothetical protein